MALLEVDLYKNIYLQAKNPICILSPEGKVLQVNPVHSSLFADTPCQAVGSSFASCLSNDELPILLNTVAQGEFYSQEIELSRKGRKSLHLDISASGIQDKTGQLAAVIIISRDQTQRRESDQLLLRFNNMVDQSNDAFFIIDTETSQILDINKRACTHYGYSREEMLQLKVLDLNPGYLRIEDWLKRIHSIKKNQASYFEATHQTKTGETFPVEVSHQNVQEEGNNYIIAVVRDISERRAAEAQDRKAQRMWEKTFNSISDIITIQDLDLKVTQCNRATTDAFNLEADECIGKYCYELFSGLNEPCPDCPIFQATEIFEPYTEEIFHRGLGKTFTINVSPILDDDGKMTGFAHFAKDITEQKELGEQLRQAQKMESLGTLAGGIAHDFNNILSAIMGYTQLAQLHIPQESKALDALRQVTIGGQRATELVKQILSFSRKTEYQMAPVEIQTIITEALKLLRPSLPTTIDIMQEIDQNCPPILADSGQIHQIIMNLCTNAYHAMREQKSGVLGISLNKIDLQPEIAIPRLDLQAGEYLQLLISDTGTGMDKATLEKIFEPYFTTKNTGEGTGLGLAVAHGIIRDFGGHITVYSEPGQGTCFNIYLPIPEQLATAKKENLPSQVPMGTEHLLVVDDEEAISNLIKDMLERYGYQVTNTSASLDALRIFTQNPELFDLVITDYAMPQMHGIDLATELLKVRSDLPILLCTGFSDIGNTEKALQVGIKSCISKPMQSDQLALVVRQILDKT